MSKAKRAGRCRTCGRKLRPGSMEDSRRVLPNKGLAAWAFFLSSPDMGKKNRKVERSEVESIARELGASVVYCAACGKRLFKEK